jgi:hypothetical protein
MVLVVAQGPAALRIADSAGGGSRLLSLLRQQLPGAVHPGPLLGESDDRRSGHRRLAGVRGDRVPADGWALRLERGFWGATALTLLGAGIAIYGRSKAAATHRQATAGRWACARRRTAGRAGRSACWTVYSVLAQRWFTAGQVSQLRRTFLSSPCGRDSVAAAVLGAGAWCRAGRPAEPPSGAAAGARQPGDRGRVLHGAWRPSAWNTGDEPPWHQHRRACGRTWCRCSEC